MAFDAAGHRVAAGYSDSSPGRMAALTVYVLSTSDGPPPSDAEREQLFQTSRHEVLAAHPGSEDLGLSTIAGHDSGGSLNEFRYQAAFAGSQQEVTSFLAVFRDGDRLIKYRITGLEAERNQVYRHLIQAIHALSKIN